MWTFPFQHVHLRESTHSGMLLPSTQLLRPEAWESPGSRYLTPRTHPSNPKTSFVHSASKCPSTPRASPHPPRSLPELRPPSPLTAMVLLQSCLCRALSLKHKSADTLLSLETLWRLQDNFVLRITSRFFNFLEGTYAL